MFREITMSQNKRHSLRSLPTFLRSHLIVMTKIDFLELKAIPCFILPSDPLTGDFQSPEMVQELQHEPEDFFNLSTLAEVTLIAGKLSTTDINEIKNYINKTEDGQPEGYQGNAKKILLYHDAKHNYESTKKKWKNNWENFKGQETHYKKIHALENSPSSVSSKSYAFLSSSCSSVSSDDDSTKSLLSYSHKVFDRKKQRSFKQSSTESEYDFHFDSHRERNYDAIKDRSCDDSNSDELAKSDENLNDKNEIDSGIMEFDRNSSESLDEKNDDQSMTDHICPECGKKYSTSEFKQKHDVQF